MIDQEQEIICMSGATSGLGLVAACELAHKGAHVIILYRNASKINHVLDYYKEHYSQTTADFDFIFCDMNSFDTITKAAAEIHVKYKRIDTLILNAGIMSFKYTESADGIEETLQTNLIAPVYMTDLFVDLLKASKKAKIIFTASALHQGYINFNDLESKQKFVSYKVYSQSKLGVILITRLLAQKLEKFHISVYAQHPGMVNTDLGRSAGMFSQWIFKLLGTSAENGAKNLLYLAMTPKAELQTGAYYASKKVKKTTTQSYDMNVAQQLLDRCKAYLSNRIQHI